MSTILCCLFSSLRDPALFWYSIIWAVCPHTLYLLQWECGPMQICLFLPHLIYTTYEDSPILSPDVPFPLFYLGKVSAYL